MLATGMKMMLQRSLASPASLLAERRSVGVLCPACCWRSRRGLHSTATAQARPTSLFTLKGGKLTSMNYAVVQFIGQSHIVIGQVEIVQATGEDVLVCVSAPSYGEKPGQRCKYLSKSVLGKAVAPSQLRSGAGKTDVFEFKKVLPKVVQDLTDSGSYLDVPAATKRLAKVRLLDEQPVSILQYNVTGGKKNRGLGVVVSYRMLASEEDLTAENLELAHLMGWAMEMVRCTHSYNRSLIPAEAMEMSHTCRGWAMEMVRYTHSYSRSPIPTEAMEMVRCTHSYSRSLIPANTMEMVRYTHSYSRSLIPAEAMEMLHGSLLITQDSLDQVETRRGKPCWYLTPQTTPLVAINDANLLVTAIYQLLKTHFKNQPYYVDVTELFQDVCHKATMGQVIDIETRADKTLQQFTMERYKAITKYKTVYHTFQMPVSLALYMADYMNCYMEGDEGFGARSGSDIEDGKCTWLAVVALQRASSQQKIHLQSWACTYPISCLHNLVEIPCAIASGSAMWLYGIDIPLKAAELLHISASMWTKCLAHLVSFDCNREVRVRILGNKTLPPDTYIAFSDTDDGTVLQLVDKRCGPKKIKGGTTMINLVDTTQVYLDKANLDAARASLGHYLDRVNKSTQSTWMERLYPS
uniref:(California timema) hypothetical protein n=1 Tax=Timema californicum TaxID=61474 RepID=A0A7R9IWA8_TIMCA|nr:unnamed protein product [Timema californicum]